MASLNKFGKFFICKILERNRRLPVRFISTSGKNKKVDECSPPPETLYKKVPDFTKPSEEKNWVSYGYNYHNKENDRLILHFYLFSVVSVIFGGIIFIYIYYPDRHKREWALREAFIRLHERQQLGLDLIDPNYVHPSKINLPPDEEIAEEDIII